MRWWERRVGRSSEPTRSKLSELTVFADSDVGNGNCTDPIATPQPLHTGAATLKLMS